MRRRLLLLLGFGSVLLLHPRSSQAGMPMITLSDIARARVETISFFLLVFLAVSWLVGRLWNYLGKDFARLPRLTYRKSLVLVGFWSFLFLIVLTMISGARELMTPGAWEKNGVTYRLRESKLAEKEDQILFARRSRIERLREELWKYAASHGGHFPPHDFVPEIPEAAWRVPDPSGMRYVYVGGLKPDEGARPLAFEPGIYGRERFVLLADGEVKRMGAAEIEEALGRMGS